jgi:hypothetical protein
LQPFREYRSSPAPTTESKPAAVSLPYCAVACRGAARRCRTAKSGHRRSRFRGTGRPYSLVCTKNQASYDLRAKCAGTTLKVWPGSSIDLAWDPDPFGGCAHVPGGRCPNKFWTTSNPDRVRPNGPCPFRRLLRGRVADRPRPPQRPQPPVRPGRMYDLEYVRLIRTCLGHFTASRALG